MDWKLALVGLLVGVLVGTTGMGGGSLLTPILVLLFGFKPTVAIGTDIVHGALFKSVGAWRHRALGNVEVRLAGWILAGSAPSALAGVALAAYLDHRYGDGLESWTSRALGVALLLGGAALLARPLLGAPPHGRLFERRRRDRVRAVALGLSGGGIVGLTSVGSGTLFALVLILLFPITAARVVGTDVFHAAALLWVAGLGHLATGHVDVAAVGSLLAGSVPGVLAGAHVSVRLAERTLRLALGAMLVAAGIKLAGVPASHVLVPAVLFAAAAVVAAAELNAHRALLRPLRTSAPQRGLRRQRTEVRDESDKETGLDQPMVERASC